MSCYAHSSADFYGKCIYNKHTKWTDSILTYIYPRRALLSASRVVCRVIAAFYCYLIRRFHMKKLEHISRVHFSSESKRIYGFRILGTRGVPFRHHGDPLPSSSPLKFFQNHSNFALEERTTLSGEWTDVQTFRWRDD